MQTISKLHYITTTPQLAEQACRGGVDWIQLRLKDLSYEDYIHIARGVQGICRTYNARLIINDNVALAKEIKADGVHIGKEDMPPSAARDLLGNDFIIGATANTLEDVIRLSKEPIDYIGMGPYRFTTTKKKLSPILGLEGYRNIFRALAEERNIPPIVGIGGIMDEDISLLGKTGLHGVALSGIISAADDVTEKARSLRQLCNQYFQSTAILQS